MNALHDKIFFELQTITSCHAEFPARYMAACNLHALVRSEPQSVNASILSSLEEILLDLSLLRHRQSFFLFKETAGTMASLITDNSASLANKTLNSLKRVLRLTKGSSHKAVTETLGSLPFTLKTQVLKNRNSDAPPTLTWQELVSQTKYSAEGEFFFKGRSLVVKLSNPDKILVIKIARLGEEIDNLSNEMIWMEHLHNEASCLPVRFDVPQPVLVQGNFIFRLAHLPTPLPAKLKLHHQKIAIAFVAHKDYFSYANEPRNFHSDSDFVEVMGRNSWLLGYFAAQGLVHTAPIPLFHNRVQHHRREDNGLYDWTRGGRLDQWLASCRHPNIGLCGTRDFEHFSIFNQTGKKLYQQIGVHILSLFLVTASYFRNRQADRVGLQCNGNPVDARHLFDKKLLVLLIQKIVCSYYEGFTGRQHDEEMPFDVHQLASRMIEEMGVDNHMHEILRLPDQNQMDDNEFKNFLISRGFSEKKASSLTRGSAEIALLTGPHLGGFNQQISIPEIIDTTATTAASCVLGLFTREKEHLFQKSA